MQRIAQAIIRHFRFPPISKKARETWAMRLAWEIDQVIEPDWEELEPYEKIRIIEAMGFSYSTEGGLHIYSPPPDVIGWKQHLATALVERELRKKTR